MLSDHNLSSVVFDIFQDVMCSCSSLSSKLFLSIPFNKQHSRINDFQWFSKEGSRP